MQLNNEVIQSTLPVELLFVPNYISSALKGRNSSIQEFEAVLKITMHRYAEGKPLNSCLPNVKIAKQYILSKLSKIDIEDIIILNNHAVLKLESDYKCEQSFFESLFSTGEAGDLILFNNTDSSRVYKTLETLYDNNMRILNNETIVPFDVRVGTDCLLVILNSGFTNYIINNDSNTKLYLFGKLLNAVVKAFGEERAKASYIFRKYVELLKLVSVVNK